MNKPAFTLNFNLPSYLSNLREMIHKEKKISKSRSQSSSENSTGSNYDKVFLNRFKESSQNNIVKQNDKNITSTTNETTKKNEPFETFVNVEKETPFKATVFTKIHNTRKKYRKESKLQQFYRIIRSNILYIRSNRKEILYILIFLFLLVLNIYNFGRNWKISSELDDLKVITDNLISICKKLNDSESSIKNDNTQTQTDFFSSNIITFGLTGVKIRI
jgi:hypothetical protein